MKINYDPQADAIYIELLNKHAVDNQDINNDVSVDFDEDGNVIGIEVLNASDNLGKALFNIEFTQIPKLKAV